MYSRILEYIKLNTLVLWCALMKSNITLTSALRPVYTGGVYLPTAV